MGARAEPPPPSPPHFNHCPALICSLSNGKANVEELTCVAKNKKFSTAKQGLVVSEVRVDLRCA